MAPIAVDVGQAFLRSLGNEARSLFTTDNTPLFDPAGFLADPGTPPASQIPVKALGRAICRSWANRQGDSNNPAADRLYGRACTPYLESIDEAPEDGELGPPFEGGQCVEKYIVAYEFDSSGSTSGTVLAIGPIGGILEVDGPSGSKQVFLRANSGVVFGGQCFNILNPSGQQNNFLGSYTPPAGGGGTARITGITPCGSDTCGDPPPEYRPPRPINITVPIVPVIVNLPGIGEVNVDVEVFPDATISLCSGDVGTCVEIGDPSLTIGGGGDGGSGGDVVPDGGTAGDPADTGDGGTAAGEAPEGQELVGVRVEVLESPIGVNTYDNVAVTVFRGIGYVRMGYPNRLALDLGGAAVISPQFFLAPVRGLTNWEVRANNGFINRVTPFYRENPS